MSLRNFGEIEKRLQAMSDTKTAPAADDLPEPVAYALQKPDGSIDYELVGTQADCEYWSRPDSRSPERQDGWPIVALYTADQMRAAIAAERARLTWLYTHCLAIGMTRKSDSGLWEHDIALFTHDQKDELSTLREQLEASREKQRMLADHAVRVDNEAFKGNVGALSKLDLDAMDAQPLLLAVQNWDISTGRARELLRCWVLGTFKPDMLPECGEELFTESEEPREAWSRLHQQLAEAVQALEGIIVSHEGYCEHHVGVSNHSHYIADIAREALAAIEAKGDSTPPEQR